FSHHESANGNNGATGQAQIVVHYGQAAASDDSLNGSIKLYHPLGARTKAIDGRLCARYAAADAHMLQWSVAGFYRNVTAVNAIRFLNSTGNIASGTIRMYGMAK
ncbi:MAG TPA: hypothetical protein VK573_09045, partial [Gemmatimonadales bacterium]|nr:hypothetical protein [Gemmatimonadales bacterium]